MKTYKKCFIGSEAVDAIIRLNLATNEKDAVEFGNKLIQYDIIQHVLKHHTFKNEFLFYRFIDGYQSKKQSGKEFKKQYTKMSNKTQPTPKQILAQTDNANNSKQV